MKGTYRCAAMRVIACGFALGVMLLPPDPAASAATAGKVTKVSVQSRRVYTPTGVKVRSGETVTIRASGFIHFGSDRIARVAPAGLPRRAGCDQFGPGGSRPWPAPELDCWSLIARIGAGPPFAVGAAKTFRAKSGGELVLGVNDNYLPDNSGAWAATVTVVPASAPTTTPAKPAPAPAKGSSNTGLFVIAGALVLAALVAIVVLARVARSRRPAAEPVPPVRRGAAPAPTPADPGPVVPLAEAERRPDTTDAPVDGEFTDVNIFEVEFPDRESLRVGYNYFPEGTVVHFRIAQRARGATSGEFVTNGGGSRYHFVTVLLGEELEPNPEGTDVTFTWDIGGVPFQYSVRRVPAG